MRPRRDQERPQLPQTACSAEPVGDVFAMREDAGEADRRFAAGYFGALAERADHAPLGLSGGLSAVLVFECCLSEHDLGERCPEDLDDLCSAALMGADPAVVTDAELLPPAVHYQVEQVRVVAAGQMSA